MTQNKRNQTTMGYTLDIQTAQWYCIIYDTTTHATTLHAIEATQRGDDHPYINYDVARRWVAVSAVINTAS